MRKLLADGNLEAVIVGDQVVSRSLQPSRLIAQVRNAVRNVGNRVGGDAIDGVAGTGQNRGVVVVVVVRLVDGARTDIAHFQYPTRRELILNPEIILPGKRRVDDGIEWSIQSRVIAGGRIKEPG